jgi:hypothetical protein
MRMKPKNKKSSLPWLLKEEHPTDLHKKLLISLAFRVRHEQFKIFMKYLQPKAEDRVIDVGASSVETLPEINYFEKNYPFQNKITVASIDEPRDFRERYPSIKYIQIEEGKKLPFADNSFDIAVSWATLEHVGGFSKQRFFIKELFRISKKVFITTPYRGCFYEPHSELLFVHWLPWSWFLKINSILGKKFWADEKNLRCLWLNELHKLLPNRKNSKILVYKTLKLFPSHLLVIKK